MQMDPFLSDYDVIVLDEVSKEIICLNMKFVPCSALNKLIKLKIN